MSEASWRADPSERAGQSLGGGQDRKGATSVVWGTAPSRLGHTSTGDLALSGVMGSRQTCNIFFFFVTEIRHVRMSTI